MRKLDFIDLKYTPKDDIVCLFRIEPNKMKMDEAANTVALESSVGTWTDVNPPKHIEKLKAKVFSIHGNFVKIAYPSALFEKHNIPNILSSIAGNIFGMKAVKNLRLEDISFPKSILGGYKGPEFGMEGIRRILKVKERPFLGTIIKPKLGLFTKEHAKSAYESWRGGCDFVKDDENLSSQDFNKFEKRVVKTLEVKDRAEQETGEKKGYLINVTAETNEMIKRAERVKELGAKFIMVDVLTTGWSSLQTLRDANLKLSIHGHRAMHAALTRNPLHGMKMIVIADFCRLLGIDSLHIGTGIGKLEGDIADIVELEEEIEFNRVKETKLRLYQDWGKIKPTLAVASGGLQPGHIPFLMRHLGNNISIQMGGGIHGHPWGSEMGARAGREAIDAVMLGISLKEYSRNHRELMAALDTWEKD